MMSGVLCAPLACSLKDTCLRYADSDHIELAPGAVYHDYSHLILHGHCPEYLPLSASLSEEPKGA